MSAIPQNFHLFGVRHHGPGCARLLLAELERLQPDCLLIEGPPEADALLGLAADPAMKPPVALLVYAVDDPRRAAFFPLATFSPEWQAIRYALQRGIPARFMDLPQRHQLAPPPAPPTPSDSGASPSAPPDPADPAGSTSEVETAPAAPVIPAHDDDLTLERDPLTWLARAAGLDDGEDWWERLVEQRQDGASLFPAIAEAMTELRASVPPSRGPEHALREARREAWMRETLRAAHKEGFQRIAVVCGAWHVPALAEWPPAARDRELLTRLPRTAVEATWTPWTYGRLAAESGYGAGVTSPGYYDFLWEHPHAGSAGQLPSHWMVRVARLLREQGLDASSAHAIEAVRLAETLAAFRGRTVPGLAELNEAVQTILCHGDDTPLALVRRSLIVGERLGEVPAAAPAVPLARDLADEQRRLRLKPEALERLLDLDLRKPGDLERSHLLHRLVLLGIDWGTPTANPGGKGTFHELWQLRWQPEFAVRLVEASVWGNTVENAATGLALDRAHRSSELAAVAALAHDVLLAELPAAVAGVVSRLEDLAALTGAVSQLMDAVPALARIARYGSVRRSDAPRLRHVLDGMVARIVIGLPGACASLDDDAATALHDRLRAVDQAVKLLEDEAQTAAWQHALQLLAERDGLHGLIAGAATRRLLDDAVEPHSTTLRRLAFALSPGAEPAQAAAWLEGFLHGSGLVLLHDQRLWAALDEWVAALPPEAFQRVLPLLRRTFGRFEPTERRQLRERSRQPVSQPSRTSLAPDVVTPGDSKPPFHLGRAEQLIPILRLLLNP